MFGENVEVLEELIEIIKSAKYRFIDKSKKNSGVRFNTTSICIFAHFSSLGM